MSLESCLLAADYTTEREQGKLPQAYFYNTFDMQKIMLDQPPQIYIIVYKIYKNRKIDLILQKVTGKQTRKVQQTKLIIGLRIASTLTLQVSEYLLRRRGYEDKQTFAQPFVEDLSCDFYQDLSLALIYLCITYLPLEWVLKFFFLF